jgi:hypothetical protein
VRQRRPYQSGPDALARVLDGALNSGLVQLVTPNEKKKAGLSPGLVMHLWLRF